MTTQQENRQLQRALKKLEKRNSEHKRTLSEFQKRMLELGLI